jgi:lipopolysaccharide transport system permease protein
MATSEPSQGARRQSIADLRDRSILGAATALPRLLPTLYRHRFLLGQLAWRSFAARYAGSYLGWLWTPLSTAVQIVLFVTVFSVILKIRAEGLGIDLARRPEVGFGVFLITGFVPYLALNDAVLRAARVFRSSASLVQRVRLPLEVLVVGDVLGALLHHAVALVVVLIVCGAGGHMGWGNLPWVVLGMVLLGLWVMALALLASVAGAALPDLSEGLGLFLQVALYAAPIVYPLAYVKGRVLQTVIGANPLTPLVGVMRAGLISAAPPGGGAIAMVTAGGMLLLVVGAAVLDRYRATIPDLL